MKKVEAIIRHSRMEEVKEALTAIDIHGMTLTDVKGFGRQGGHKEVYRGSQIMVKFVPKLKLELVIEKERVDAAVEAIRAAAATGEVGDGKIFISSMDDVIRIRTKERGRDAL